MGIQITQDFSSQIASINNAVPSAMSRTFYVDAVNGNDTNSGSDVAPFKTIQKAIDSVPVGGLVYITLLSDCNQTFSAFLKHIVITISSGITWTIPMGAVNSISGCSVLVRNEGHLIIDRGDGTNVTDFNYAGFIANHHESTNVMGEPTYFYLFNYNTTDPFRVDSGRALFGIDMAGGPFNTILYCGISDISCSGNAVIDGWLFRLYSSTGVFKYNSAASANLNYVDSNNTQINMKTKIGGIVYHTATGEPLNIISNLDLSL